MTEEGNDALQDAADDVIERLQGSFGERWGGAWLHQEPTREICIAVVAPTAEDADLVSRMAGDAGWVGTTVAVRYSGEQLEEFMVRLEPVMAISDSIVSMWPDHQTNKVHVELNASDMDAIQRLYAAVPEDALAVSVDPAARYELLGGSRSTSEAASP